MARHLAAAALLCGLLVLLCQQQPAWAQAGTEADPFPPADPVPGDTPAAGTAAAPAEPASANNTTQPSADDPFGTGAVGENGQDLSAFFDSSPAPGGPPALGLALASGPAAEKNRLKYTGTGTTSYPEEVLPSSGAVNYACSFGFLSPAFRGNYVGLGATFYNKGFACGQCIKLQCDDAACKQPGKQLLAMVVDLCGDCFDADMSIASPLFQNLTGVSGPAAQISWDWASCGDLIEGNIMMLQKPGGSAFYQAFNFANSRQVVVAARMNGKLLKRSASGNWWEWNPGQAINPKGPFRLELLGRNREVLRVSLPQLRSSNLGVQFKP